MREYWNIGVVDQTVQDIAAHGMRGPVRWLPAPAPGTMFADPHCIARPDGGLALFAEFLDYRAPRGEIWAADVPPGQDAAAACFRPWRSGPAHMSYPLGVAFGGQQYLVCESWQSAGVPVWRADGGGWLALPPLMQGRKVVDPTLFPWQGRWWLFCTFEDDAPDARLHVFHAESPFGAWAAHPANPVRVDAQGARPAGPLFLLDGVPVRPGQDCGRTYGGGVVLHAVEELSVAAYRERVLRHLDPVPGPYGQGLHTICPAGPATLIDGKRWGLDPLPVGGQVCDRLRRLSGWLRGRTGDG
ncbi:MAG: hypothetical protein JSR21_05180 [Proteobacteria bacterium]|nr:hypothetical protein [Pseudomonadota bacterium]